MEEDRTSPALLLLVIATGLLAIAAVGYALTQGTGQAIIAAFGPTPTPTATPGPTPTPTPKPTPVPIPTPVPFNGTGPISFGSGYDADTLAITGRTSKFKRTAKAFAWSAALTGPVATKGLTLSIARRSSSGYERLIVNQHFLVSDPQTEILADKVDLAKLLDSEAGSYVMRIRRGVDVLAQGTFTLTN